MGYFDQHLESLDPRRSCVDEVRAVRPDMVVDAARQYLARFRFYGDDAFRAVGSLSGGERTRLALSKLLLVPRNLLLLDEPTNHLDIPACEILEEALAHFEGTVVLVSHDRYFLDRVSTRVLHVEEGRADFFPGGYADYHGRQRAAALAASQARDDRARQERAKVDAKGRDSHDDRRRRLREHEKRQRRLQELDKLVADGETRLTELRGRLAMAPGDDWEVLARLADEEQTLARQLDAWSDEWLRLSEATDA